MIAQVPVMLAAPLAIWLAIDARADGRTRRWCFRAVAVWLLATVVWDMGSYRDWVELDDDSDPITSVINLLALHAAVYGAIAVGWLAASFLPVARLRLAAGVLAVPTLIASPVLVSAGDIVQQRATWVVPFGALLLLPSAALFVNAMSKRQTGGYLPGVSSSDTAVAEVIAGMAGLLGVLFREQILLVYREQGFAITLDDTVMIAVTAVALIFACAVGWLRGVRDRSDGSPRLLAKSSAIAAVILGFVSYVFAGLLGG